MSAEYAAFMFDGWLATPAIEFRRVATNRLDLHAYCPWDSNVRFDHIYFVNLDDYLMRMFIVHDFMIWPHRNGRKITLEEISEVPDNRITTSSLGTSPNCRNEKSRLCTGREWVFWIGHRQPMWPPPSRSVIEKLDARAEWLWNVLEFTNG